MTKRRNHLPEDFLHLHPAEQRRALVQKHAESFEAGHPDAWLDLVLCAIDADPDIPEPVKVALRGRLIGTLNGTDTLDPISTDRRQREHADQEVYVAMLAAGGSVTAAKKVVARQRGVSPSTIGRAYERHIKRWPQCRRLDGRRKAKRPAASFIRG